MQPASSLVFASFAETRMQLESLLLFTESLHVFGGEFRETAIWIFLPEPLQRNESSLIKRFSEKGVQTWLSQTPQQLAWLGFSGKVFAASLAEAQAEKNQDVLCWLDPDTLILQEPGEFILEDGCCLGYRPVMHKNIGLLISEPPDEFWHRIYELIQVPESAIFSMITPADGESIQAFFNAGCLIVRPKCRLLRTWAENFTDLSRDPQLTALCRNNERKKIFFHQAVLTATLLKQVPRAKMKELSFRINYPLFFNEMFGSKKDFHSLVDVVTLRHEFYFWNPNLEWFDKLSGPADRIAWMKDNLRTLRKRTIS